jgi:AraC family transcriptional activator of pobA
MLVVGATVRSRPRVSDLATDRLPDDTQSIVVALKDDRDRAAAVMPRQPHRHAYHELIWNRCGVGRHLIDGRLQPIRCNTLTVVGRGQVHEFIGGMGMSGAIVRFGDELLADQAIVQGLNGWLLNAARSRPICVPEAEAPRLEDMLRVLEGEFRRPIDHFSLALQSHLLSSLLLWLQRWHDDSRLAPRPEQGPVQLYHRFLGLLEREFAAHHDALHYSEVLRMPAAALSASLARVCGQTTKEIITERVMLEAARLLRFSELQVGEIAFRAGFADLFYFSRAFKRHYLVAPLEYRARSRATRPDALVASDPRRAGAA